MSGPDRVSGDGPPFRFDPSSGEIEGPADTSRLAPQPAALFLLLMERRGQVVGRRQIEEHLWPAGGVDVDQGMAFALREIRKGLEKAGCDPGLVETIPRRGYRLRSGALRSADARAEVAAATEDEGATADGGVTGAPDAAEPEVSRGAHSEVRRRSRIVASAGVVGVVVVLAALITTLVPSAPSEPVIAVVEHRSDEAGLAPLAAELGITLTTMLTDSLAGAAGIVGPTGTASLAGADDVEGARERLGACLLASGAVSAVGPDSVIVFTQLVRTTDRVHAWASVDTLPLATAASDVAETVLEGARLALAGCPASG